MARYAETIRSLCTTSRWKSFARVAAECLVISLIVAFADLIVIFLLTRDFSLTIFYLSLALLFEGGLGLLVGGITASFSRVFGKIGERLFKSKPSSTSSQKEVEKNAIPWIITGLWLVLLGLVVSAI